jgi:hypothetical protein
VTLRWPVLAQVGVNLTTEDVEDDTGGADQWHLINFGRHEMFKFV